jgi:outer membrane protein assembly factor BamE (lipoprotein component of BamABCDE complex)
MTNLLRTGSIALFASLAFLGGTSACVTENAETGEMVPRGKQRYPWDKVKKLAEHLQDGMRKADVILLMGSPAEMDEKGDEWVYLPERYGILVPAEALELNFKDGVLVEHGYHPIVLGARL